LGRGRGSTRDAWRCIFALAGAHHLRPGGSPYRDLRPTGCGRPPPEPTEHSCHASYQRLPETSMQLRAHRLLRNHSAFARGQRARRAAAARIRLAPRAAGLGTCGSTPFDRWNQTGPRTEATPRAVLARGTLAEDEQNNIAVFKTASPSVVHITPLAAARGLFP